MSYQRTMIDDQTISLPSSCLSLLSQLKFKKEIAAEYGLSPQTFSNILKRHNVAVKSHGYLTKREMFKIYKALGWPTIFA